MGSALPNGNDLEVIGQLNAQFTGANLTALRDYIKGPPVDDFLWNRGKSLARASYRLNIWPTKDPSARPRWFAFLQRILSQQNIRDIQDALQVVIENANKNIVGAHFWAQYDESVPQGTYRILVTDEQADSKKNIFKKITVLTDHEIDLSEKGDPDPPKPGNETGPEHPLPHLTKKGRKSKRRAAPKKKSKAAPVRKSARSLARKRK